MLFLVVSFFVLGTNAQFGFFDQMFNGGGQQQQQQPQNVRSDSQWYQSQYEGGKSTPYPRTPQVYGQDKALIGTQHIATNTSAPAPSPASTSRTTALVLGRASKTKLNWVREYLCVRVKADGRRARRRRRLSWRGRAYYELMQWDGKNRRKRESCVQDWMRY